MIYVECPNTHTNQQGPTKLFLAGGIRNCPDWQKELVELLKSEDIVIFNPRRENFPIDDPSATTEQINWEHKHLEKASVISFWFCEETLCPIVLYELGCYTMSNKLILIGIHPNYKRRVDVEVQTKLKRPLTKIVYSLQDLAEQIKVYERAIK